MVETAIVRAARTCVLRGVFGCLAAAAASFGANDFQSSSMWHCVAFDRRRVQRDAQPLDREKPIFEDNRRKMYENEECIRFEPLNFVIFADDS